MHVFYDTARKPWPNRWPTNTLNTKDQADWAFLLPKLEKVSNVIFAISGPFLESPVVYIQGRGSKRFADNMIKLSVNKI